MIFLKTTVALLLFMAITAFDSCSSSICVRKGSINEQMSNDPYEIDIDKDGRSDFVFWVRAIGTQDLDGSSVVFYNIRPTNNGRLPHIKHVIPAFVDEPTITDSLRGLFEWSSSEFTLAARNITGPDRNTWTKLWGDGKISYLMYELNYTNYGWIRLTINTTNNSIIFHDYYYNFQCYK